MPLILTTRNKKKQAQDTAYRVQNPDAPLLPGLEDVKDKPPKDVTPKAWHCHIKVKQNESKPHLNVEVTYNYIYGFTEELKLVMDRHKWEYDEKSKKFWISECQLATVSEIAKDYYEEVLGFRNGLVTNLKTGEKWKE